MPHSPDPSAIATFGFELIDGATLEIKSKFLTRRQTMRHDAICDEIAGKSFDDPEIWKGIKEAYELGITSPTFDEIEGKATDRDIVHLAMNYTTAVKLCEAELGKSKSRRLTVAGASVANVTAEPAPTDPTPAAL